MPTPPATPEEQFDQLAQAHYAQAKDPSEDPRTRQIAKARADFYRREARQIRKQRRKQP
ncbi:hypothetical protein [Sciscionella marina]|uniref:hypothetical protein n=1 Tax=Sciscionella marina TaxID=508770 RepID=UPI00036474F6|nr:hypothetical protein [Sciscionella marina]